MNERPRETRHVVFVGAYGIQNAGDDAPLLVIAEGLRSLLPDVDFTFTVFSRHPDPLLQKAAGASFLPNLEYGSREAAAGKWFRGFNYGDEREELERIEAAIREADLVVAGAGNVLIDIALDLFRGPIPLLATYCFLADLHRTPFILFGISAGPLVTQKGRELSAWIARRSSGVTVRDKGSARLLEELAPDVPIDLLPDPVLGLAPCDDFTLHQALREEGIPMRGDRPRLALALRDLEFLGFDREVIIEALRRLADRYEFLFVPQCTDRDCDDRAEAQTIIAELGEVSCHTVTNRHRPDVLMRMYESADVTLAIRLHGAVFSAMVGVPVVGITYLPKVSSFLKHIGHPERALGLDGLTADALIEAIESARAENGGEWKRRCQELAERVPAYLWLLARKLGYDPDLARRIDDLPPVA